MSKKPPNRPGITFEVGAKIEAQDYLHKWYPSHIEKIDYEEGKMLVHFDRWSHRYDEWIYWDSSRLRPLQRPALRKEGLKEEDEMVERLSEMTASRHHELPGSTESTEDQTELPQSRQDLRSGEEVLARWTDCRYYPAKIESISKEGSYTVQFYDGVVRCVKRMHIKSMLDDSKGQDWNALVKAATAKDKPRTSASSNRDHEESSEDGDPEDEELEVTQMPGTKPLKGPCQPSGGINWNPFIQNNFCSLFLTPSNTETYNEGGTSHKDSFFDLDHNKFSCKVPGCSKAFRKAKLLDYHLKYYHNAEKEFEAGPSGKVGRTRAISTSVPGSTPFESIDSTRRRTVSTSASFSAQSHLQLDSCGIGVKPTKTDKKKRSSASFSSDGSESLLLVPNQEQTSDTLHDKILKKVIEKDKYLDLGLIQPEKKMKLEETCQPIGKKKDKERKDKKDHFKVKQKKKKKKKKSKQHNLSDFEDLPLSLLERCSSPCRPFTPQGNASSKLTAFQYPRAILSVDLTGENLSDIDFLEDSSTESLFLSGDEYGQDLDSFTMDDFQEEDNEEQGASREIVRCICEMDDENGFMIQCEECMCWQHSVCVGLLEDCVPDLYICYMCRDPPGQRWSAKYQHSKEWLNKGHMYGLPFLSENYSHQNAKKIVSTHQLLADVFSVKKVLHGLQLKMDILQRKHSPSLHLWARSWVKSDEDKTMVNCPNHILIQGQLSDGRSCYPSLDNYITSEHSYQKPLGLGLDPWSSTISEGRSNWEPAVPFGLKEEKVTHHPFLSGCLGDPEVDSSGQGRSCLQLQLNLLNHVEDVQKQVARRMDLIEKELDVLENWLDFTGELEPPDPLARLPQLKWRMKQLLNDLVKVQQMGSLFSI
uniref:PHD finger protein 20 like 1 n=1 Tax=Scleropages formosus TaxID=113540 RepID=A0A8C9RJJ9_SCLFO